jgi:hypothetical protein
MIVLGWLTPAIVRHYATVHSKSGCYLYLSYVPGGNVPTLLRVPGMHRTAAVHKKSGCSISSRLEPDYYHHLGKLQFYMCHQRILSHTRGL